MRTVIVWLLFLVTFIFLNNISCKFLKQKNNDFKKTKNSKPKKFVKSEVLKNLQGVKSLDDFLRVFNINKTIPKVSVGVKSLHISKKYEVCNCEPRPTNFTIPAREAYVYPDCVQIKKCGGCCSQKPNHACEPTAYATETIFVYEVGYGDLTAREVAVQIPHHASCRCKCALTQSDCGPNEILNSDICFCVKR